MVHTTNTRGFATVPLTVHNSTVVVDTHGVTNELSSNYNKTFNDYNNQTPYIVNKECNESSS